MDSTLTKTATPSPATQPLEDNPHNLWLCGTPENKKKLHYIASQALSTGKASAEFPLQSIFENIAVKAHDTATFYAAITQEQEDLEAYRKSQENRFKKISFPLTKANLAECFALVLLKEKSHEEAEEFLKAALKGNRNYYELVFGVTLEHQKRVLKKLRKLGYRNWEKHRQDFNDFIYDKIALSAIGKSKNEKQEDAVMDEDNVLVKDPLTGKRKKRLTFFSFDCKAGITIEQLQVFYETLVVRGYFPVSNPEQLLPGTLPLFAQTPARWLMPMSHLVYLFTRLSEDVFALPYGVEVPLGSLNRETSLQRSKARAKTDQMKVFSSWLNQRLRHFFRDKDGKEIKNDQLVNGKKYILKEENDRIPWKLDFEDLFRFFKTEKEN